MKALKLAQSLIPMGRTVLPRLPERPSQLAIGEALGRWPQLWGLPANGEQVKGARRAFELAFPDDDTERLLSRWVLTRGRGLSTCLIYLSRWVEGSSRLIRADPEFQLPEGPSVVAFLHYSIDPIVQLSCISAARDDLGVRWPIYPIQPGAGDDRELWFAGHTIPPRIAETFLPITDPSWVAAAFDHLREGGTVFLAIDAPFDSSRRAQSSIPAGQIRLPVAPSIEMFSQLDGVQLSLLWPRPESRSSWTLGIERADSVDELAQLAGDWIESHPLHWAGWPFLVWREDVSTMRRKRDASH